MRQVLKKILRLLVVIAPNDDHANIKTLISHLFMCCRPILNLMCLLAIDVYFYYHEKCSLEFFNNHSEFLATPNEPGRIILKVFLDSKTKHILNKRIINFPLFSAIHSNCSIMTLHWLPCLWLWKYYRFCSIEENKNRYRIDFNFQTRK